jgi:hypothetical protein
MMHRKSKAMADILDGLVRGNLRSVEESAEHMKSIGAHLNWYSSSKLYEKHDEGFRQSTLDLLEAAQKRDHDAAKSSRCGSCRNCGSGLTQLQFCLVSTAGKTHTLLRNPESDFQLCNGLE